MSPQGVWQVRHPHLWGANEFHLDDILVLDIIFLLDQIYGRMLDPWEGLCGYK